MENPTYRPSDAELAVLARVIRDVSCRHNLFGADAEDFGQTVQLRILENKYDAFVKFLGESSLRTYLTVVVTRLLLDWRNRHYGKWRPSALAKRLGPDAVVMDRLMNRDGYSKEEASEILASARDLPPARCDALKTLLRPRRRARFVGLEALDRESFVAFCDPIESGEADRARRRRTTAILKAYRSLDREDRRLIALRYLRNLPFSEIGEHLQLEPRVLYRRIERTLGRLRTSMPDLTATG